MREKLIIFNFFDSISSSWTDLSTTQKGLLIVGVLFVGFVLWRLFRGSCCCDATKR